MSRPAIDPAAITADLAPASAKEPRHDPRSRVVTSARTSARACAGARASCTQPRRRRTRARAGAARARPAAGSTQTATERCQLRALTAFVPSRDERSSPGCGVAGDPRPGSVFLENQTGELRS